MVRFASPLLVLMLGGWSAQASLSPPLKIPLNQRSLSAAVAKLPATPAQGAPAIEVTDKTEVLLDGKRCAYRKVPATAEISYMEVTADRKFALKIHFRSK